MKRKTTVAGVTAVCLAMFTGVVAHAATDPAVAMGSSGTLKAKILVSVPVHVTCAAGEIAVMNNLFVEQAAGRTTTTAFGGVQGPLTCDGTDHAYTATALVTAPNAPMHRGQAVANFGVTVGTCGFVNPDGSCAFVINLHSSDTGLVVIRIKA